MSGERIRRWSLALIALFMLPTAIQGVLHFGYHVDHLDGLETVDQVGLIASLVSIPVLAALSLWAGRRPREKH